MEYIHGMSADWGAMRMYRNEDAGIQKETITKRMVAGDIYSGWRKARVGLFLDGDERQFKNVAELYVAYMEKVCGVKHVD